MADWNQLPVIIVGALIAVFIVFVIVLLITPAFIDAKLKDVSQKAENRIESLINELRNRFNILPPR